MKHDSYDDSYIRGILNTVKTIAMVGVSANTARPSYFAFKYLLERRYHMIPINPGLAGQELLGQKVYGKLADIPEPVDMVDIFRASQYALGIVQEAQTAAAVLGHNFPESRWYKDAYRLVRSGGLEPREDQGSWISRAFKKVGLG